MPRKPSRLRHARGIRRNARAGNRAVGLPNPCPWKGTRCREAA